MSPATLSLPDLETLTAADPAQRAGMLRRIEDLMLRSGFAPGDSRLQVFDEVMIRLAPGVEPAERAAFAGRMAALANAPPRVLDLLARDVDPAVAGPLLEQAAALPESTLVLCARERGQDHLMALARRASLAEPVTDVLVERADTVVLVVAAGNAGARFSDYGLSTLVGRAGESDRLTLVVARRPDLPRHLQSRLFSHASEDVRAALAQAGLLGAAGMMLSSGRMDYREAAGAVERLARTGGLGEPALKRYLAEGALAHVVVALSAMARLPVPAIEQAFAQPRPEMVLLIARATGLDWSTAKALLALRPVADDMVAALASFERLRPETARSALDLRRAR